MIPVTEVVTDEEIEEVQEPGLTYHIDPVKKRIVGTADGLEAVKQAVFLILQSERFEFLIYSTDYGTESVRLVGASASIIRSELSRSIRDALTQDDRISDVINFQINIRGDTADIKMTVVTIYGNFEQGVTRDV